MQSRNRESVGSLTGIKKLSSTIYEFNNLILHIKFLFGVDSLVISRKMENFIYLNFRSYGRIGSTNFKFIAIFQDTPVVFKCFTTLVPVIKTSYNFHFAGKFF